MIHGYPETPSFVRKEGSKGSCVTEDKPSSQPSGSAFPVLVLHTRDSSHLPAGVRLTWTGASPKFTVMCTLAKELSLVLTRSPSLLQAKRLWSRLTLPRLVCSADSSKAPVGFVRFLGSIQAKSWPGCLTLPGSLSGRVSCLRHHESATSCLS